jgi:hypothetical protein
MHLKSTWKNWKFLYLNLKPARLLRVGAQAKLVQAGFQSSGQGQAWKMATPVQDFSVSLEGNFSR